MSVLLLGAGGMLAADLGAMAPPGRLAAAFSRHELDIRDEDAIARALDEYRPRWVINAAAYTQVDRAETDYDAALAINGTAVGSLGRICASRGVAVVHYSTDYVFAGDARTPYEESDSTAPVNAYGRSKLAGEEGLVASGAQALILRTQWLFGTSGRSFPRTMWERATRGLETKVVGDQFGRPTSTVDLARATWALIARDASGLYHIANEGTASWFDLARAVFQHCGADGPRHCTSAEYPTPARRPTFSVLATGKLERDHGVMLPHWRDSLTRFIESVERQPSTPEPRR